MARAGRAVVLCVTLTQDLAKMLAALHKVKIAGDADFLSAIQVAQLALRHRQNKRQEQRIVMFVGSPVRASDKDLKRIGGQLKKNKVAVDIINFGERNAEENEPKLKIFHDAVNNHDNSTLVNIPPGTTMLSEVLTQTSIVRGQGTDSSAGASTGGADDFSVYGVDATTDPELLWALRESMAMAQPSSGSSEATTSKDVEMKDADSTTQTTSPPPSSTGGGGFEDDMDEELRAALNLSMESVGTAGGGDEDVDMEDDMELAQALALSRQTHLEDQKRDQKKDEKKEDQKKEEKKEHPEIEEADEADMSIINSDNMGFLGFNCWFETRG